MSEDFPLPIIWEELESILTGMKACRESGDVEGYNEGAERLIAWRDMHPKEVIAVLKVISNKS